MAKDKMKGMGGALAGAEVDPLAAIDGALLARVCDVAGVDLAALKAGQLSSFDWRKVVIAALAATPPGAPKADLPWLHIQWQEGPIKAKGTNGVQLEDVADKVIERLAGFQAGPFPCAENAAALDHFKEGVTWLKKRTAAREAQGVEGTDRAHRS